MRGQLSAEYLVLALVSLSLIAISLSALSRIREAGDHSYNVALFRTSAQEVYNSGQELCSMGSGSSMHISIRQQVELDWEGGNAVFSNSLLNLSNSKPSSCPFEETVLREGEWQISNDGGTIVFSMR